MFVSDFHFGRRTAGWNYQRAVASIKRITEQVIRIASDVNPQTIRINFLGDIMDGEGVYLDQAYELELVGFEQVYEGSQVFLDAMIAPLSSCAQVAIDGVPGNHAYLRLSHKKTNLDSFFYAMLEQLIRERRLNSRVKTLFWNRKANETLEIKVTGSNFKVLIGHGHFLKSVFVPSQTVQSKILSWLATFNAAKSPFNMAAFGHFHRFAFMGLPGGTYLLFNGCMLLHDEFSLNRYGHHGDRIWACVVVENKRIVELKLLTDEKLQTGQQLRTFPVLTKNSRSEQRHKLRGRGKGVEQR